MEKLLSFLVRLDKENIHYTIEKSPCDMSIRVHVFIEPEYWCVDFSEEFEVEIEIFKHKKFAKEPELEMLFDRMARAWRRAADDLGIDFISPYTFQDNSGVEYTCAGLVKKFGSPKGTLIHSRNTADCVYEIEDKLGYRGSGLPPRYYETYDRERFIELLQDLGWYGKEEDKPEWL